MEKRYLLITAELVSRNTFIPIGETFRYIAEINLEEYANVLPGKPISDLLLKGYDDAVQTIFNRHRPDDSMVHSMSFGRMEILFPTPFERGPDMEKNAIRIWSVPSK